MLLNGASGIAVGLATEIPSHNLREVAAAAVALLRDDKLSDDALFDLIPGPDFPGGGQLISAPEEIRAAYLSGRGSLKVRARWKIEDLARGQWQLVVTELPHGTSAQKVLEEIEELSNPKVKAGKKTLSADQLQLKASLLAVLDGVRDESSKDAAVRIVFEPKSRTVEQQDLINTLLAHTSLESSASVNLTMIGADGRPTQKSLRDVLVEWVGYRQTTVRRRTEHRLNHVNDRIHVLEGRQLVLLNIDEVIRIIRESDEPKAGADRPLQPQRPPGGRHSRDPAAPAGAAGGHSRSSRNCPSCATSAPSWRTSSARPLRCAAPSSRRSRPTPSSTAMTVAR